MKFLGRATRHGTSFQLLFLICEFYLVPPSALKICGCYNSTFWRLRTWQFDVFTDSCFLLFGKALIVFCEKRCYSNMGASSYSTFRVSLLVAIQGGNPWSLLEYLMEFVLPTMASWVFAVIWQNKWNLEKWLAFRFSIKAWEDLIVITHVQVNPLSFLPILFFYFPCLMASLNVGLHRYLHFVFLQCRAFLIFCSSTVSFVNT